jgi:hypothetical protein
LKRRSPSRLFAALLSVAMIILVGAISFAAKVRCPVCRQVFDEKVKVCPDDGTDLTLLGQVVEEESKDAPEPEAIEESPYDDKEEDGGRGKYKRHDLGGDRRRIEAEEGHVYSDRYRRVGEERRSPEASAERRRKTREKRQVEFDEKDTGLKSEFEDNRRNMWRRKRQRAYDDKLEARDVAYLEWLSLWGKGAPTASLGARVSWMGEGSDPGFITGPEIDINILRKKIRLGLSTTIGFRILPDRTDMIFMEHVSAGIQLPWRFSPYLIVKAGLGPLASNRFGNDLTYLVRSFGAESGLDCRVNRVLVITPSVGYVRYVVDDAYWNSFTAKISVGF